MTFLGLVRTGTTVARACGLITTEADRLLAQTHGEIRAILENDFKSARSALEVARASTSDSARERALKEAAAEFRRAESQDRLYHHHRGFAAAVNAALAAREGDSGAALHWTRRAVDHYDAALRGIYRRAEDAARATGRVPGSTVSKQSGWTPSPGVVIAAGTATGAGATAIGTVVAVTVGAGALALVTAALVSPLAPLLAKQGKGLWLARQAGELGKKVPGAGLIDALNDQALGVHALASELGVSTEGKAVRLEISRVGRTPLVDRAELIVVSEP